MNCKKCNYKLNPNASFCNKCGKPVVDSGKGNFFKDNILSILIGMLIVIVIGLIITIVSVKLRTEIDKTPNNKIEEQIVDDTAPENNIQEGVKHSLDETAIAEMEELIVNLVQDYAYAVNIGDEAYLDKYLVHNGEEYKSYRKLIPNYYSKGIILDVVSVEITNIERYDDDTFRASLITEYEISNSAELRYQKESIDYLIKSKGNGVYLVDKTENYNLLDKYTIESYS